MILKKLLVKNSKFKSKKLFKRLKKSVSKFKRSFFEGKTLLILGLLIFFLPFLSKIASSFETALYARNNIITSQFTDQDLVEVVGDYPVKIIIPQLRIDLEVKPSKIVDGVWEIHPNVANFGVGSSLPSENGNTVIFAHAKKKQFGPLRAVKKGFEVSVQTKNSLWYTYKVVEMKEVKPYDMEVIAPTNEKTLTLFTCSGFADSKRLIIVAK
ncbi:sortase [Candidatus Gottesmanbacteria bacterium]|nr:sortase [Candidatus Gottesmanbacteria bacterium]